MKVIEANKITSEEANLYDRQIRLWGVEAQNKLRNSSVLLIGLNLVGAEVAKNLILAGVKKLHLHDSRCTTESDNLPIFLLSDAASTSAIPISAAVLERCRQLNPLVEIGDIEQNLFDEHFSISSYDIVCLTDFDRSTTNLNQIKQLDERCRSQNVKFVVAGNFGEFGYCFFDFGTHSYFEESLLSNDVDEGIKENGETLVKKPRIDTSKTVHIEKVEQYVSIDAALSTLNVQPQNRNKYRKLPNGFFFFDIINRFCELTQRNPSDSEEDAASIEANFNSLTVEYAKLFSDPRFEIKRFDSKKLHGTNNGVFAIIGGIASQQIITAISQNEKPINNCVFYDGYDCSVCKLPIA